MSTEGMMGERSPLVRAAGVSQRYTLSLGRWHKVAERIAREVTALTEGAHEALTNTRVGAYVGHSQERALHAEALASQQHLERAFQLQDEVYSIRRAVGDMNARVGVTANLADLEKLQRRQRALSQLIEAQRSDMVAIDELRHLSREEMSTTDRYGQTRLPLRVRMIDRDAVERWREQLTEVRSRVYALSDQIADLNREALPFELSAHAAEVAGL